ncbi:hypothetical protein Tco_0877432 [Tanacetum coccineum]|uniref:Uncharacterized protein n=1 Tax=Tanacetum coccineum TaxID=301880 RepID=A0ABQ5BV45_9ASTR
MAGKGCALHHWVHDVVFNVSNQLVILTAYAPECTLVHDPPAPWDQVHTLENVVHAPTTVGQPPRNGRIS